MHQKEKDRSKNRLCKRERPYWRFQWCHKKDEENFVIQLVFSQHISFVNFKYKNVRVLIFFSVTPLYSSGGHSNMAAVGFSFPTRDARSSPIFSRSVVASICSPYYLYLQIILIIFLTINPIPPGQLSPVGRVGGNRGMRRKPTTDDFRQSVDELFPRAIRCSIQGWNHRNNRHRMRAPISCQSKNCRHKMADL